MVNVYDWIGPDGKSIGCGTRLEFDHWTAEGTMDGTTLGAVICQEPASEDARRLAAWARVAA